jgi:hypothetical protein
LTCGVADLEQVDVTATAEPWLPVDDHSRIVELA